MNRQRNLLSAMAALTALVFGASPVLAVDVPGPSIPVSATVSSSLTFSVTVVELVPATPPATGTVLGSTVTTMNFGTLASNGTFDPDGAGPLPPQPRSLNSTKAFQVFFGANAQQRPFSLKQTALPLQSGANVIPAGAFIVTPLAGVGGDTTKPLPGNIIKGARGTAIITNRVLFSSSGGPSDTMAATYGITDDPAQGATQTIPLDQATGTYGTNVVFTLTVT